MDVEDWLAPAGESIFLNLTQPGEDDVPTDLFEDDFHPTYTHQLFEDEAIFGYKELQIKISFRDHDMQPTFESQFEEQWKGQGKIQAVDYKEIMSEYLQTSAFGSSNWEGRDGTTDGNANASFASWVPPGELVRSYDRDGSRYEIWKASLADSAAKEIFYNMKIVIPFFIEGGTCMDLDDPSTMVDRWSVYFLYKIKGEGERTSKASPYSFVGFSTTYRWWVFPSPPIAQRINSLSAGQLIKTKKKGSSDGPVDSPIPLDVTPQQYFRGEQDGSHSTGSCSRICLSQFIILPPYQRSGHGKELYSTIFRQIQADPLVFELCVEDPNEDFDCLRDYCDFIHLRSIPEFRSLRIHTDFPAHTLASKAPVPISHMLPRKTIQRILNESKFTKRQFDRMTEIHLFSAFPTAKRRAYLLNGKSIATQAIQSFIKSGGKLAKVGPAAQEAKYDLQYAFWSLMVKNRIFLKNEDVLRQLDESERPEKVEGALANVQIEYADWIEVLIGKKVLPDDTLLPPSATTSAGGAGGQVSSEAVGRKRKLEEWEGQSADDDDDSVLGRPVPKRMSMDPGSKK